MDAEKKLELGRRVTSARKALRYTQKELADAAGVSLGVVSNLENGRTVPQSANRRALTKVLGEDVFGDAVAQEARDLWPHDVQLFTDVLGQYLASLPPERRSAQVAAWMGDIVNDAPAAE